MRRGPEYVNFPRTSITDLNLQQFLQSLETPDQQIHCTHLIKKMNKANSFITIETKKILNSTLKIKIEGKSIENYESEIVNNRLDRFIVNTLREPLEDPEFGGIVSQITRGPAGVLPTQPRVPEQRRTFVSRYGLTATGSTNGADRELVVGGQTVLARGDKYTRVNFRPGGRLRLDTSKLTDSIANGIRGLTELIAAVDKGDVALDSTFVGITNINMALIAQRLGFRIVDACRSQNGEIDKSRDSFQIAGRLEDIRQKLAEFAQSGLSQRVLERQARLEQRPQQRLQPA